MMLYPLHLGDLIERDLFGLIPALPRVKGLQEQHVSPGAKELSGSIRLLTLKKEELTVSRKVAVEYGIRGDRFGIRGEGRSGPLRG